MSPLKSTIEDTVTIPFRVRLEPYLVESICELSRLTRDKGTQHSDISGLLFGRIEAGTRVVEALKTFVDAGAHSELARRQRWDKAYKATFEESKNDPELSAFEVVGWFSFRTGSGLLSSDVTFHNEHFRKPEDLALIVWREGPSQITAEVYSKSESDTLTSGDYRWASVRLSADIRHMRESVELAMRVKLSDDSYLRAYDNNEAPSQMENLKRMAAVAGERLMSFLYRRKDEEYTERVRGYIGDGRLPSRSAPSEEAPPSSPAYFNPYSDLPPRRNPIDTGDAWSNARAAAGGASGGASVPVPGPSPFPAPAPSSYPTQSSFPTQSAFPAASSLSNTARAFGTAPARSPEPWLDSRLSDTRFPSPTLPSSPSAFELAPAGRPPRTERSEYPEVSGLPMVLRPPTPRKSFPWVWAAGLFVLCSGSVFAFLALGGSQNDGGRLGQVFHSILPSRDLDLRVRNEDDRLLLSWNQRNRAVESAADGTLQIVDGQQHREIHLDGQQVADGSVLYRPLTSDVTFRLEVRGEQGAASGSVRVLDNAAGRQAVLDVSAPATAATQSAAGKTLGVDDSLISRDRALPPQKDNGTPSTAAGDLADSASANPSAGSVDPNYVPLTATPMGQGTTRKPTRGAAQDRRRTARYQVPESPAVEEPSGGSTINGWDTSAVRSKSKGPATTPVFPTVSSTGGGYVPPRPLMQVMPNTSSIPDGTIQASTRVEVQVNVDQQGRVSSAHVTGAGVNEKISSAALAAARQWSFDPASNNGQHVSSEHTIVFEFRPQDH